MKILAFLFVLVQVLSAEIYYSKVEPYEVRDIGSNVSGLVLKADEDMLGKKLSGKPYILIDSELDIEELTAVKSKIEYLKDVIKTNNEVLKNLEESLIRKRKNYENIKGLKIKSLVEKDREFHDLVNSENIFLNTKKEILNLKVQLSDLKLRKAQLQRAISDKSLKNRGFILYSLKVRPGQFVAPGTPLAQVADISKAKLTIYLDKSDLMDHDKKSVYIDGKKTDYKISRVIKIADATNISKYMAQIIIKAPDIFSKLVKIELK